MGLILPGSFEVPLFPLPNIVLLPGMVLPLHIFEPRYRKMLADALAGERLIAMANLMDGWQSDYLGKPPVHEIAGVGRIAEHHGHEDGTSDLALIGIARCQIREELARDEPYRIASVSLLKDKALKGAEAQRLAREAGDKLAELGRELIARAVDEEAREALRRSLGEREDPGQLADFLAGVFLRNPGFRQRLLENTDPLLRCRQVLGALREMARGLEPGGPRPSGRMDEVSLN